MNTIGSTETFINWKYDAGMQKRFSPLYNSIQMRKFISERCGALQEQEE